jgi:hypothetical protein
MDAAEIAAQLRELERQRVISAETVQRCCNRIFARYYRYQGGHWLWVAGFLGYTQSGITPIPPVAIAIIPAMRGYVANTICKKCGRGLFLVLDGPMSITMIASSPPTFATVIE